MVKSSRQCQLCCNNLKIYLPRKIFKKQSTLTQRMLCMNPGRSWTTETCLSAEWIYTSRIRSHKKIGGYDGLTIATSPFNIVGIPSSQPAIILLLPRTILRGTPLPALQPCDSETLLNLQLLEVVITEGSGTRRLTSKLTSWRLHNHTLGCPCYVMKNDLHQKFGTKSQT